ncbi:MAG: protein-L-isoaspartate(D-aspartate) O-methyltransferase [Pseudomonadota bacterium]|nr:protein-L-isoaspartate(D-aspartate) O-methyltransferase [Pseudomonadota bacterium]
MMRQSQACINMIKQQLRTNNITNEAILALYIAHPREKFLPKDYQQFAYADMHIPVAQEQIMLTPLEEAKILQSGKFKPEDTVLVLGSCHTYLIALLSYLCRRVIVIDTNSQLMVETKKCLNKHKINNIDFILQHSYALDVFEESVDAIISPAAIEQIPNSWLNSLKPDGKLFVSLGNEVQHAQWLHLSEQKVTGHEFVFSTRLPFLPQMQVESKFIF